MAQERKTTEDNQMREGEETRMDIPVMKEESLKYTVSVDGRRGIVLYIGAGTIAG